MEERSAQFFDRLKTSKNLPTLPQILLKLIELCNSEGNRIKDISQIIDKDPSLSAKVMNMANASFYGRSKRVARIDQALTILGQNSIKNIAVRAFDTKAFNQGKNGSVFGLEAFWRHSMTCAAVSKQIAKKIVYPRPDEAFLTGLLHDIGKLVLRENFPNEYADILTSSKDQQDLVSAEAARFGATHCDVGAWLIKHWSIESFMADAVLYHHESLHRIQDALPLLKIIYVGNVLCPETDIEKALKFEIAKNILGLEMSEVEKILCRAEVEVNEIARSLEIDIEPLDASGRNVSEKNHNKQEDLVKKVKDMALLQGTLQNLLEARNEDAILNVVQQGLDVLFDVRQVLFFLYEPEKIFFAAKMCRQTSSMIASMK